MRCAQSRSRCRGCLRGPGLSARRLARQRRAGPSRRSAAAAPAATCRAAVAADAGPRARPPLTRADVEAWLDGFMPYALQRGDIAGAVVVVVKDGQVLLQKGYGYCRRRRSARRSIRSTRFPPRLGLEALHLDRGDAAGRAGQARPRRRRQHVPRFQDPAARRQADHAAQHHDPHRGLRGELQGPDHVDARTRPIPLEALREELGAGRASSRRARRRPIRTTRPRSPATSSSASRASRSTTTSTSTSSRRSA